MNQHWPAVFNIGIDIERRETNGVWEFPSWGIIFSSLGSGSGNCDVGVYLFWGWDLGIRILGYIRRQEWRIQVLHSVRGTAIIWPDDITQHGELFEGGNFVAHPRAIVEPRRRTQNRRETGFGPRPDAIRPNTTIF